MTDPQGWGEPVNLGNSINSRNADSMPHLSSDGLALYFSSNRPSPGRPGYNNVWVSRRKSTADAFGPPASLGAHFAAFHGIFDPHLSADGRTFFFNSRGLLTNLSDSGELWQVPVVDPPALSISRE